MTMIEKAVAAKRIKAALHTITGRPWNVAGGRGRHQKNLLVQAPIERRVGTRFSGLFGWVDDPDAPKRDRKYTTAEDCRTLSQVFGCIVLSLGISFTASSWESVISLVERKAAKKENDDKK